MTIDTALCESLSQLLKTDGLAVTAVHDSESGVREALSGAFEIVILDVMLPVLDGRKVLRRVRLHSQIPAIMLTARGDDAVPASKPAPTIISPSLSILANWSPVFAPSFAEAPSIRPCKFSPSAILKSN